MRRLLKWTIITLHFRFNFSSQPGSIFRTRCKKSEEFNFRTANFVLVYELLPNAECSPILRFSTVEASCEMLCDILDNIFKASVLYKTPRKLHFPQWYSTKIMQNILDKEKAFRSFNKYGVSMYLYN